jgi:hypothetical protein
MALPSLTNTLEELGKSYLVLDVNCLFVAASLREEAWLYCGRENPDLLRQVCQAAGEFGIRKVDPDRELVTYSGGEQSILACLLMLWFIQTANLMSRRMMLYGVLESMSRDNRRRLLTQMCRVAQTHELRVHNLRDGQINELALDPCVS